MTRVRGCFLLIAVASLVVLVACSGDNPVQERASGAQAQSESNSRPGPEAKTHSEGRALADSDPLNQALAALSEWTLNLDTALFAAQARMEHASSEAVVNTRFALQRSPVAMLTSIELSAMSSFFQVIEGDEDVLTDETTPGLMLHELSTAEGVFMAFSGRLLTPLSQYPADVSVLQGQSLFPGRLDPGVLFDSLARGARSQVHGREPMLAQ